MYQILQQVYMLKEKSPTICSKVGTKLLLSLSIFGKEENGRKPVNVLHSLKIVVDVGF